MTDKKPIFHFPQEDGSVVDIDAVSYSEARRIFYKTQGHFPTEDQRIEVEVAE